jgi:hypothetical protein
MGADKNIWIRSISFIRAAARCVGVLSWEPSVIGKHGQTLHRKTSCLTAPRLSNHLLLRADAVASVQNPLVRAAILRVKHGQAAQGFTHGYDKAYHSHSST